MLGGYFTPIAILVVAPALIAALVLNQISNLRILPFDYLFFSLILYTIFVALFNYFRSAAGTTDTELLIWTLTGALFNIVMWSIGRLFYSYRIGFNKILIASIAAMLVIVLLNIGDLNMFALGIRSANDDVLTASYQSFARSFVVSTIVVASTFNRSSAFFLSIVAGLAGLYWIGARSEFAGFLVACCAIALAKPGSRKIIISLMLLSAIFFFTLLIDLLSINLDSIEGNRMFQLLRLEEARSVEIRNQSTAAALNTIKDHPFLGDYGSYADFGSIGGYAHNLLSAWVNLGLVGFAAYLALLTTLAKRSLQLLQHNKDFYATNPAALMAVAFSFYSIVLVVFAKDYSLMTIGLSVGLLSAAKKTPKT